MKKSALILTAFIFYSALLLFLLVKPIYAVELEQVVAQSQVGDKVQEISKNSFYSYDNHCGSGACHYPIDTGWTSSNFNDSSWVQANDAFVLESGNANR